MFSYVPKIRYSRLSGDPVIVDLSGLSLIPIVVRQRHQPVLEEDELLDYSMDVTKRGWRVAVRMEFAVSSGSAADVTLANLWEQINDPDVELGITLNGSRFDDCYLKGWSREPIAGKNVGVVYAMEFQVKKLRNPQNVVGDNPPSAAPETMEGW